MSRGYVVSLVKNNSSNSLKSVNLRAVIVLNCALKYFTNEENQVTAFQQK